VVSALIKTNVSLDTGRGIHQYFVG
jgi:hypothetical protein